MRVVGFCVRCMSLKWSNAKTVTFLVSQSRGLQDGYENTSSSCLPGTWGRYWTAVLLCPGLHCVLLVSLRKGTGETIASPRQLRTCWRWWNLAPIDRQESRREQGQHLLTVTAGGSWTWAGGFSQVDILNPFHIALWGHWGTEWLNHEKASERTIANIYWMPTKCQNPYMCDLCSLVKLSR